MRPITTMNLCALGAVSSDREGVLGTPRCVDDFIFDAAGVGVLRLRALLEREDGRARGVAGDGALERGGRIG
jgi:hypothetical protein